MPKLQVIYIASASHSGSTLLENLIGRTNDCIGMGEVFQLVDHRNKIIENLSEQQCSCGANVEECGFWGKVVSDLKASGDSSESDRYQIIFDNFLSAYSASQVFIDSSKAPEAIKILAGLDFIDLKVVHLVRDFRAWLVSMQNSYTRNNVKTLSENIQQYGLKGIVKYLQRFPFYGAHHWLKINSNITKTIDIHGLDSVLVSYESVCFDTDKAYERLSKFIGREIPPIDEANTNHDSHNIFGNRMRFDSEKLNKIRYDKQWFYRSDWLLPYFLYPRVAAFNKRLYSHEIKK